MLPLFVVMGSIVGYGVIFAFVILAALPFRLMQWSRGPALASALAGGTLFSLAMCMNGTDHLERRIGFYAVAFLVSVKFYGWRDARLARQVGAAVGLAGALTGGAANGSGELDDLRRGPEVQL